ncbi:MAG: 3-hydroxybutyryl-CoA dehydrogenase [Deltaproteobacteria bacterium]|nr:3-hydroxybutyryl-CoA dehydrogenase [Deltaproteobacteria bacterium]MBW2086492.1 3-hydroxybutyryl-CoA dehydrogenase [Deltaproteobacteria bacterium]
MEIKNVGVIGVGTMGSQIGIVCARGGYETTMVDLSDDRLKEGWQRIQSFLQGQEKRGRMDKELVDTILSRITTSIDLEESLSKADLVIEAVYEDMEIKKEVFQRMDKAASAETILASNTSTLWITEIATATNRPEKCIGTHFLIPAALTPLVEVVRGVETSDETHDKVVAFLRNCGKETVTVVDAPGFVINRIYLPMINEAFCILENDLCSAEEIDRSCTKGLGFPLGPLAAADASGLDIVLACIQTLHRELGEKYRPAPLLVKLVKAGHLGRKTGQGVYRYGK